MRGYIDLTGQTFGRLTVLKRANVAKGSQVFWDCDCSCGQATIVRGISLRRGDTKSCGCLRVENCTKLFAEPRKKYANKKEKRSAYYTRTQIYQRQKGQQRHAAGMEIVITAKNRPCADCGKIYHYSLMDFDHVDSESKSFTIGKKPGRIAPDALRNEIAKCEVICALCHRVRTWNRSHPDSQITL